MLIYNSDGTLRKIYTDREFGWNVESNLNNEDIGRKGNISDRHRSRIKNLCPKALTDTPGDLQSQIRDGNHFGWFLYNINKQATSKTQDTNVEKPMKTEDKENVRRTRITKNYYKQANFSLEMTHKTQLTNFLIATNTVESLLLLAIVNNAMFLLLNNSIKSNNEEVKSSRYENNKDLAPCNKNTNKIFSHYMISSIVSSVPQKYTKLYREVLGGSLKFNRLEQLLFMKNWKSAIFRDKLRATIDNRLSLMNELVNCDKTTCRNACVNECNKVQADDGRNGLKRNEMFRSIGLDADTDRTLTKFFDKTCEMHCEVEDIKKCFQDMDDKITCIKEAIIRFQKDLFETKFLDDVLLLLEYKFEDVLESWPFRVKNLRQEDKNLII